jgi:protein-disulfide isomerase
MRRGVAIGLVVAAVGMLLSLPSDAADRAAAVGQDPAVLRLAERALAYFPGSSLRVVEDELRQTPSGAYRMLSVERSCANQFLSGTVPIVLDELGGEVWVGSRGELPAEVAAADPKNLRTLLDSLVPQLLKANMGMKVGLEWDPAPRAGALMRFELQVDTGYGVYAKPGAVTADGRVLILGAPYPVGADPVQVRRELFRTSPDVVWDHGAKAATVEIVELSDFECPGCKAKWPLIKQVLDKHGAGLRHGFVAFPLTTIHPWAFRAACAGWCVAEQRPDLLLPLKELFYSLQRDMEVGEVTPTARDFAQANQLDLTRFDACYLRQPSLAGVHAQMGLGNRIAVAATPTFVVNGWLVQVPEESWFPAMVDRLIAGQEP